MTYAGLVKRLSTPPDWAAPTVLTYEGIRAGGPWATRS